MNPAFDLIRDQFSDNAASFPAVGAFVEGVAFLMICLFAFATRHVSVFDDVLSDVSAPDIGCENEDHATGRGFDTSLATHPAFVG